MAAGTAALAVNPSLGQAKLAVLVLGAAVYQALSSLDPSGHNVRGVTWAMLLVGAAIALAGLAGTSWVTYKLDALAPIYLRLPHWISGLPGTLPGGFHPNEVGGTLALFAPLALALSIHRVDRRLRVAAIATLLLCGSVLLLTQSRSALFGAAAASILVFAAVNRPLRYGAAAGALAGTVWLASLGVEGGKLFLMAFDQASGHAGSLSFASRLELWQRALYVIRDFPFTGIGLGSFPSVSLARYPYLLADMELSYAHAHNFFLETAVDFGVAGLLAFLAVLFVFGAMLVRARSAATDTATRAMALGLGAGMAAHLLFGLTDTVNWGAKPNPFLWAYLGAGALVWNAAGRPRLLRWQRDRQDAGPRGARQVAISNAVIGDTPATRASSVAPAMGLHSLDPRFSPLPAGEGLGVGSVPLTPSPAKRCTLALLSLCNLLGAPGVPLAAAFGVALICSAAVWRGPLIGAFENNLAARLLARLALQEMAGNSTAGDGRWLEAKGLLESAVARDPTSAAALRNLAGVYTALGDRQAAAERLAAAASLEPGNLLIRYELAQAYSDLGETELSVPLYRSLRESFPENRALKDAETDDYVFGLTMSGIDRLAAGDAAGSVLELRRALEARPGDLLASCYLARALAADGREQDASQPLAGVGDLGWSGDPRIQRRYLERLAPYLSDLVLLGSADLGRLASYLLWQGVVEPAKPLLELLVRERPGEKSTWRLLADARMRQRDGAGAVAALERVLALDPGDVDAIFARAKLLEAEQPDAALHGYRRALALSPDHLPALRAASALLERMGRGDGEIDNGQWATGAAAALAEEKGRGEEAASMRSRADDIETGRPLVAAKLKLQQSDISLVPVPLPNADFRAGRPHPQGWSWAVWAGGQYFGEGSYVGGVDEREGCWGEWSLRVSGLSAERRPGSGSFWLEGRGGKELARAGYWAPEVVLEGNSIYALSFSYKTANWRLGDARVEMIVPELDGGPTVSLPDTSGQWKRQTFLVENPRPGPVVVCPLFRNWGVGDVWFADVRLDRVVPQGGVALPTAGLPGIR